MNRDARIYLAGHTGLVGSALLRRLRTEGYENLVARDISELDLTIQDAVRAFFRAERPEYVLLAAARVGGIHANHTFPAEFIYQNLMIQANVIDAAWRSGVKKLLFLGSSCIYPRDCPQPIREEYLLTGPLEPTNEPYAVAKIAGLRMCQAYRRQYGFDAICAMPTNLYGPGDNFDLKTSHVLPALIRKFHEAKMSGAAETTVWGTGAPRRELLHVDDLAAALLFLMREYGEGEITNVGAGRDCTIGELAEMVREAVGFEGRIVYDTSMPDGTPRKQLDSSRILALGWRPTIDLSAGIAQTYAWFLANRR